MPGVNRDICCGTALSLPESMRTARDAAQAADEPYFDTRRALSGAGNAPKWNNDP